MGKWSMGVSFLGCGRKTLYGHRRLLMPRITPIHWKALERIFLESGFHFARQEGSHRSYTKPGVFRPIVIPTYDEVPIAVILNNLKTAGISREEYFRLLGMK
ncbi:MAG: type II toxin-antitoxin system HicA family toxin [Candidatus Omnitrophota bacterium]